jgi:hypothetical protein
MIVWAGQTICDSETNLTSWSFAAGLTSFVIQIELSPPFVEEGRVIDADRTVVGPVAWLGRWTKNPARVTNPFEVAR